MTTIEISLRHQMINGVMAEHTDVDAAIHLWEKIATQIIAIIGEGGFNSLYARSVFLTRSTFPWLAAGPLPPQADELFAGLKTSLEGQTQAQAVKASSFLLITFTDILASLIGEGLTTSILRLAWGSEEFLAVHPNDASDRPGDEKLLSGHPKEFKNE
jgi:hypothetical protein